MVRVPVNSPDQTVRSVRAYDRSMGTDHTVNGRRGNWHPIRMCNPNINPNRTQLNTELRT